MGVEAEPDVAVLDDEDPLVVVVEDVDELPQADRRQASGTPTRTMTRGVFFMGPVFQRSDDAGLTRSDQYSRRRSCSMSAVEEIDEPAGPNHAGAEVFDSFPQGTVG